MTVARRAAGFTTLLIAVVLGISTSSADDKAKLYRVEEGVFELRAGKSIDLTDRQVLLTLMPMQDARVNQQGRFTIALSGQRYMVMIGQRVDLKHFGTTRKVFADKDECYLDVIDFVAPKGAPATATFRINCL
jgi:hypothetical protein